MEGESRAEGGMCVGGVGKDSSKRTPVPLILERDWDLVGMGMVTDDDTTEGGTAEEPASTVDNGTIGP